MAAEAKVVGRYASYHAERHNNHAIEIELAADGSAVFSTWENIRFDTDDEEEGEAIFENGPKRGPHLDLDSCSFGCARLMFTGSYTFDRSKWGLSYRVSAKNVFYSNFYTKRESIKSSMPLDDDASLGPEARQVKEVIDLIASAHGQPRHIRTSIILRAEDMYEAISIPSDADAELRMLWLAGANALSLLRITLQ
jgi:hypothetical protein